MLLCYIAKSLLSKLQKAHQIWTCYFNVCFLKFLKLALFWLTSWLVQFLMYLCTSTAIYNRFGFNQLWIPCLLVLLTFIYIHWWYPSFGLIHNLVMYSERLSLNRLQLRHIRKEIKKNCDVWNSTSLSAVCNLSWHFM